MLPAYQPTSFVKEFVKEWNAAVHIHYVVKLDPACEQLQLL